MFIAEHRHPPVFFSYKLTGYPPISKSKDPNTNIFGQTSHKAKLKIDIKSKYYYNTLAEFINLVANYLRR